MSPSSNSHYLSVAGGPLPSPQNIVQLEMRGFQDLPPEMVQRVFSHIPIGADRKKVCLVNRFWRDNMLPLLWRSFCSTLEVNERRRLLDIRSPGSNIIKHVREFTFWQKERPSRLKTMCNEARSNLLQFITVFPNNHLVGFSSNVAIDVGTLQIILRAHRELKTLRIPIYEESHDQPLGEAPWIQPYLSNLTHLDVNLPRGEELFTARRNYSSIIRHAPKLTHLAIQAPGYQQLKDHNTHTRIRDTRLAPLQNLKHLTLSFLDFGEHPTKLLPDVDFTKLSSLRFENCLNEEHVLDKIANTFSKGTFALEILELGAVNANESQTPAEEDTYLQILNNLLSSFTGLKELYIDTHLSSKTVNSHSITQHAKTLEILSIGTGEPTIFSSSPSPNFLRPILSQCTNLTQLGICLDAELMNICYYDGLLPDIEELLTLIATHTNLSTLRMLDHVALSNPGTTLLQNATRLDKTLYKTAEAAAASNITITASTQITRHLLAHGSNISRFIISPYSLTTVREIRNAAIWLDADGQRYPRYVYDIKRTSNRRGEEVVVLVPVKDARRGVVGVEGILGHEDEGWPRVCWDDCSVGEWGDVVGGR